MPSLTQIYYGYAIVSPKSRASSANLIKLDSSFDLLEKLRLLKWRSQNKAERFHMKRIGL